MDTWQQVTENPQFLFVFFLLTYGSLIVIIFHIYRFIKFYRLNKQVDRIIATYKYQKHQDIGDAIQEEKEQAIDELSAYRLEKRDGKYVKVYHVRESDIDIIF